MRVHHRTQHLHAMHPHYHIINPHQGSSVHPSIHEGFPVTIGIMQSFDHTISMTDCDKGEKGKNLLSNDDDPSLTGEGGEVHNDAAGKGKKESPWQRKK